MNGIQEVSGSIPLGSTSLNPRPLRITGTAPGGAEHLGILAAASHSLAAAVSEVHLSHFAFGRRLCFAWGATSPPLRT
jgi:hypothetical protein